MSVSAVCDGCGKKYHLDDRFAGRKAKCKACGAAFSVPVIAAPAGAGPVIQQRAPGAPQGAGRPVPRASARPAPAPKPPLAEGEFDLSALDDVEKSGEIDDSYRPAELPAAGGGGSRRGTAAPEHLQIAGPAKAKSGDSKPPPMALFLVGGMLLFGVVCLIIYKVANRNKTVATPNGPVYKPIFDNDGKPVTSQSIAQRMAENRQAAIDAVAPTAVAKVQGTVRTVFPELGIAQNEGEVTRYVINFTEPNLGEPMNVALYVRSGEIAPHSLPCLLMPATMNSPLEGETSTEADLNEAGVLAAGGFVVVVYDVSRFAPNNRPQRLGDTVREFVESEGGWHFARNAAGLVFSKAVVVDPKRVYVFGRGESAGLAVHLAAADKRIGGIVLEAPVCDIAATLGSPAGELEKVSLKAGAGGGAIGVGVVLAPVML